MTPRICFLFCLTSVACFPALAAPPVFVPAAESPDHCEASVAALSGTWIECRVEDLRSDATEARPALQREELERALAGKAISLQAKVHTELRIGDRSYQQETASLSLPLFAPGEVIWFGKDHFAAPKNEQSRKKGFHADHKIKELACVADNSAYRFQGVDKTDGSRKFLALYKGENAGVPMLYVTGSTHNGMTRFAILCRKAVQ